MNDFGELSEAGSVLSRTEMRDRRKKRGKCETCGTKCFEKHLFKTIPITVENEVFEGRCLRCYPLSSSSRDDLKRSQSMRSMKKKGGVSSRMGKFFRTNSDKGHDAFRTNNSTRSEFIRTNSDFDNLFDNMSVGNSVNNSSISLRSDEAICNRRASDRNLMANGSMVDTAIPTRITYPELVIEEDEGGASSEALQRTAAASAKPKRADNTQMYSQAIAAAAGMQLQHNYRSHESPASEDSSAQEEEASALTTPSILANVTTTPTTSVSGLSSPAHKQDANDLHHKDLDLKESIRQRAREQSTQLDERIASKLQNARISATRPQSAAMQPTDDQYAQKLASNSDDDQILAKMEEESCTYMDILDIATLHPLRLRVQQKAIRLLAQFELTESELTFLLSSGRFKAIIVNGMDTFSNEKELQLDACYFLWNLSKTSDENKLAAARAGSIKSTLNVMRKFPNDEQVQEIAVVVLSNLCQVEEIQLSISELDGVKTIIQAMAIHHKSIYVQESSCTVLNYLADHSHAMKTNINAARGCEQISIAMVENDNLGFLHKALHAICAICADHDENKLSAINCGIIDSIVSAMQTHRDEADIQAAAALTFMNLGLSEATSPMIGENGGIDVMVRAMWLHSDNLDVQRSSCHSLHVLSSNTENQALMASVSGISAVINAMQMNVDDADIQAHSCGILANVAELDDDTRTQIVKDEALDAITIAMVIHGDNVRVQDEACSMLQNLVCASNLPHLQASNVLELINSAATKFPAECCEKALTFSAVLSGDEKMSSIPL